VERKKNFGREKIKSGGEFREKRRMSLLEFGEKGAQVKIREGAIQAEIRFSGECGPTNHGLDHKDRE
jgi:hypothetical protein